MKSKLGGAKAATLVCGVLFVSMAVYAFAFYYSFPYWDNMDVAFFLERHYKGVLTFRDLMAPHGHSHWHIGAYLILVPVAVWSQWNIIYDIIIILLVSFYLWLVVFAIFRSTAHTLAVPRAVPVLAIVSALFVFSLDQAANLLWGWQLSVFLSSAGVVSAIFLLTRTRVGLWHTIGAGLAVTFAVYSYATALVMWPIGLGLLAMHSGLGRRDRAVYAAVFALFAATNCYHYLVAVVSQGGMTGSVDIARLALFSLKFMGGSIARFARDALPTLALVGLLLAGWLLWLMRRRCKVAWFPLFPYVALALYSIGCAVLTSYGRVQFGVDQAMVPRYNSFSYFFWLALIAVLVVAWHKLPLGRLRSKVFVAGIVIVVLKAGNIAHIGLRTAQGALRHNALQATIVSTYPNVDEEVLKRLYPDIRTARRYIDIMYRYKLNIFRGREQ